MRLELASVALRWTWFFHRDGPSFPFPPRLEKLLGSGLRGWRGFGWLRIWLVISPFVSWSWNLRTRDTFFFSVIFFVSSFSPFFLSYFFPFFFFFFFFFLSREEDIARQGRNYRLTRVLQFLLLSWYEKPIRGIIQSCKWRVEECFSVIVNRLAVL